VDYTVTYFLPIPSILPRTKTRSELLNVSLVPPRVKFYTALPVSIVGSYFAQGVFSHVDYTWSYSQTEPTLFPCLPSFCQLIIAFRRFRRGMTKSVALNPRASHRFCGFGLKHRRGPFGTNMVAWWLPYIYL
jgi:hypothetical protein